MGENRKHESGCRSLIRILYPVNRIMQREKRTEVRCQNKKRNIIAE